MLTIAIPTYNRLKFLERNIKYLLPQLTASCRLMIIDNHSDVIIEERIQKILNLYPEIQIDIVRNTVNIGLFGNILRCFELCETKWLYILGDDDKINTNGIQTILKDINKYPDYLNLSYQWEPEKNWSNKRSKSTFGMEDYLNSIEAIHHVMFLSANIYNAQKLKQFVHQGHYFQLTSAPHLAILFLALNQNDRAKVFLSNNFLVGNFNNEVEEENKWDKPDFFRNIKLLLDLSLTSENKKALFYLYAKSYPLKKYLRIYANLALTKGKSFNTVEEFIKATIYYRIHGHFIDRILISIYSVLLSFPKLLKFLRKIF